MVAILYKFCPDDEVLIYKKTSSTTRFVMLNIWGYLRSDQLNGMWSMDQVTILLKLTYIYELFQPMSTCSFLSGLEQPIKNIYGFFIRHSGQLSLFSNNHIYIINKHFIPIQSLVQHGHIFISQNTQKRKFTSLRYCTFIGVLKLKATK